MRRETGHDPARSLGKARAGRKSLKHSVSWQEIIDAFKTAPSAQCEPQLTMGWLKTKSTELCPLFEEKL
jgi:hypothetical protein